jgi:hypothetical protein
MQAEDVTLAPSGAPMRFRDERNASQIWQNKTKKLRFWQNETKKL